MQELKLYKLGTKIKYYHEGNSVLIMLQTPGSPRKKSPNIASVMCPQQKIFLSRIPGAEV